MGSLKASGGISASRGVRKAIPTALMKDRPPAIIDQIQISRGTGPALASPRLASLMDCGHHAPFASSQNAYSHNAVAGSNHGMAGENFRFAKMKKSASEPIEFTK